MKEIAIKKIFVTGGAGFIGSNFIRFILNKYKDYYVLNFDKLTYAGNRNNLKSFARDPRYKFVKGDICDKRRVERVARGCSAIVNFAAESHVDRSIKRPTGFLRTNIDGVQSLLEVTNRCRIPRFIQISTDEVYGSITKGYYKEDAPLRPSSPYSASKAAADLLCIAYRATYKTPVIITRSSNNFGQYQYPEKIIPLFITNALEGKRLPVYADGLNRRDWIYVLDNCAAIDVVLHKGKIGQIYNVGGGNERTNLDITRFILKMMKMPKRLIKFVKDRPGHDRRYALNCKRIKKLGWRPRCDFNKALELTIQWYKENEWWWRPLKVL